jgi:hypothetical protein
MRKVYLDVMPKINDNRISWLEGNDKKLRFIYDDIEGYLDIISVTRKNNKPYITIKYNSKIYEFSSGSLINCELGLFLKHVNLSDEEYNRWYNLKDKEVKTEFNLSDDGTYWIGHTLENDEFWFDGNEETVNYIKSYTWRKTSNGYIQNNKGDKLHRIVMGVTDPNIFINHLGGHRWDNRRNKLSISDDLDNSKEKKVGNANNSGIVGLMERGKNNKWVGNIKIKGVNVYTKYKDRNEALIDLLIIQRHYGFRHNENLYYMLDRISELRIKEVINNIERQLNKKRDDKICSTNRFELSEDGTYYNVYDINNKSFKISLESKELVEQGIWHVAEDISNNTVSIHGFIIINGVRTTVKLHRYLFNLINKKYKNWFVVRLNKDELDDRLENLVITDSVGNGLTKNILKGYQLRNGKYRVNILLLGKQFRQTVKTEKEAIELVKQKREEAVKQRLQFHSKEELDTYLHNQELVQAV